MLSLDFQIPRCSFHHIVPMLLKSVIYYVRQWGTENIQIISIRLSVSTNYIAHENLDRGRLMNEILSSFCDTKNFYAPQILGNWYPSCKEDKSLDYPSQEHFKQELVSTS